MGGSWAEAKKGLDTFLLTLGAARDFTQVRLIGYCYDKTFDVG
ncbi:hypothetical protein ACFYUJ_28685 [Streptomyces sp. NPDC004520]